MSTPTTTAPAAQGRVVTLKLTRDETDGSIMMFEQTLPAGAKSTLHLHRDSDEVAYILEGELTCLIGDDVTVHGPGTCVFMPRGIRHAWKNTDARAGRVLFLYTPAKAGGLIGRQVECVTHSPWTGERGVRPCSNPAPRAFTKLRRPSHRQTCRMTGKHTRHIRLGAIIGHL